MSNRYPIGELQLPEKITRNDVNLWISEIEKAPKELKSAITGLTKEQLDTPYREGGWKLSQVVHHLADAHMNAYVRIKMGLTENQPLIHPFNEDAWAQLADNDLPIDLSIQLFSSIHDRLAFLLKSLTEEELKRTINHTESGVLTIEQLIAIYSWHGKHHIAQIASF